MNSVTTFFNIDKEKQFPSECCRKVYDKLDPDFAGPYGRKCIKLDGSICEKHQAIEDSMLPINNSIDSLKKTQ